LPPFVIPIAKNGNILSRTISSTPKFSFHDPKLSTSSSSKLAKPLPEISGFYCNQKNKKRLPQSGSLDFTGVPRKGSNLGPAD
jgi:hypothetical protein